MIIKGYMENYLEDCADKVFFMDIESAQDIIEDCFEIANCLYMEDYIDCYDVSLDTDGIEDGEGLADCRSYVDFLIYVLDRYGIDWSWYNVPCDLEICIG